MRKGLLFGCFLIWSIASFLMAEEVKKPLEKTKEILEKTLELELETQASHEKWREEKKNFEMELKALQLSLEAAKDDKKHLDQQIKEEEASIVAVSQEEKQWDEQYQKMETELRQSAQQATVFVEKLPKHPTLNIYVNSFGELEKTPKGALDLEFLFSQIEELHDQVWQLGQSFSIAEGVVPVGEKQFHGSIIRIGLIYQFMLTKDEKHWFSYDHSQRLWQEGDVVEIKKLIKIRDVLQKKIPAEITLLPEIKK